MAGLHVLVFEHLRPYRPKRGVSWSRRTNRKRSYWLRGKVLEHVWHLALCHGIVVVERETLPGPVLPVRMVAILASGSRRTDAATQAASDAGIVAGRAIGMLWKP